MLVIKDLKNYNFINKLKLKKKTMGSNVMWIRNDECYQTKLPWSDFPAVTGSGGNPIGCGLTIHYHNLLGTETGFNKAANK